MQLTMLEISSVLIFIAHLAFRGTSLMVVGNKDVGKSTMVRYILNSLLSTK